MKKVIFFILLTIILIYSIYELYSISALYNDQAGMSEILMGASNQNTSPTETARLNDFKFELNSWRIVYSGYIVFYIFYIIRLFWQALKPSTT